MRPLKVLYIHHSGHPGGASTSLLNLLKFIPAELVEKHVVTPRGPVSKQFKPYVEKVYEISTKSTAGFLPSAEGIDFLPVKSLLSNIRYHRALKELVQVAEMVKPDLVHLSDVPLLFTAMSLSKRRYPVVMHARTAPGRRQGFLDRLQRKWINKYVDRLICISESVKRGFSDIVRAEIVYNPVITTEASPSDRTVVARDEKMNCLFLFNFLPYKGIYETIHAAGLLKDRRDIHFYIAGSDIRSREHYQSAFGRLMDRLGLMPDIESWIKSYIEEHELQNVTLLGHVDDIDTLLQRIDVNLAPVRLNAPPRSVFEAAAFEIPTILALTDIVEDLVEHNKTGLIIPPRNPEAIARAILTLRSDDTARVQMGEQAREKLVRQHDPKKGADCVMNIYRSVLKQPSERRTPVVTAS